MNDRRPIIGIITAVANNYDQKQVICGVAESAMAAGYDTAVFSNVYNYLYDDNNLDSERHIFDLAMSDQLKGLIIMAESFVNIGQRKYAADLVKKLSVPVVIAGCVTEEFEDQDYISVNSSDRYDMKVLTSHLIEKHGYTNIDMLAGFEDNEISQERVKGYLDALEAHGIEPDMNKVHYGDFWLTSGRETAAKYISGMYPLPEAIVCANDCMAYTLIDSLADVDIKIPEKVAVVGYEYSDRRLMYAPLLTTFKRNRRGIGNLSFHQLQCLIEGKPLKEYEPPAGKLILGDSCPCGHDEKFHRYEIKKTAEMKDYEHWNLYSTMEQRLTNSRSLEEFIGIIGDHQWLIRYVQNVFLCLYSNWYDVSQETSETMSCRTILPWLDTSPFEINRFDLETLFSSSNTPSVYYFTPMFVSERKLGHIVLKYDTPDGYDDVFRHWLKSVTNGLEFLRMKNDIQYLTSCQNLSEYRDTLTGMYNYKGIERVYSSKSEDNSKLCFILLRTSLSDGAIIDSAAEKRIEAVLAAAHALELFCGTHDAAAHISENEFACLVRSDADPEILSGTLEAMLIRQKKYIDVFGVDSFVCSAVRCDGEPFSNLVKICTDSNDEKVAVISERRTSLHYSDMADIRTYIYTYPEKTFDQDDLGKIKSGNLNSFRSIYKKCFGISFHQDCIAARIQKAKYYLSTTTLNMTDVSEKCGYIDNKYFLRQFTANMGITALKYRNLLKGK